MSSISHTRPARSGYFQHPSLPDQGPVLYETIDIPEDDGERSWTPGDPWQFTIPDAPNPEALSEAWHVNRLRLSGSTARSMSGRLYRSPPCRSPFSEWGDIPNRSPGRMPVRREQQKALRQGCKSHGFTVFIVGRCCTSFPRRPPGA